MLLPARLIALLVTTGFIAGCGGGGASTPSPMASAGGANVLPTSPVATTAATPSPATQAPSARLTAPPAPVAFTSTTYGYSLLLPAGWTAIQATATWDGSGAPFHDVPEADQFISPTARSAWFFGAPTTKSLADRVKESIQANAANHSSTCPAVPDIQDPITIGGEPGVLVGFNCGILINTAITVHDGFAYLFGLRDPAVHAATDPLDRAMFLTMLDSVRFPS
jgi:hypothetical protein